MISPIRLATLEEVEAIASKSDLTPASRVLAFEDNRAVVRVATEVDPFIADPKSPKYKRALFLWGIENLLRFQGNTEYYFNIREEDKEFQEVVKDFGAQQVSLGPELRFKKVL